MKLPALARMVSRWKRSTEGSGRDGEPPRTVDPRLEEVVVQLLLQRKWSYLRYVHLREGFLAARDVRSVLAIGAGRGLAELALALEFPKVRFRITDVASERTPNYQWAQDRARAWQLPNVEFGLLDVTKPIEERFDFIASVEVIEHIEDDEAAIAHMRAAARKYVFCLVPFADDATLADPRQARRAWARHQHYRFGYSPERFRKLFDDVAAMRGCYFRDQGFVLRQILDTEDDDAIRRRARELAEAARGDVADRLPDTPDQTQGIWVLARTPDSDRAAPGPPPLAADPDRAAAQARLREVRRRLVFYRSWSYFRYLHLREAFLATENVATVLSIGSGRGLAELALAIEFPAVRFRMTDVRSPHTASSDQAMELARNWGIGNLERASHDILEPLPESYDLVASVEVLEHIEDEARAADHMRRAARRYTFCLVPYADERTAADPERRRRAWEKDHHYRFGYSAESLQALFPDRTVALRGCYWQTAGARVVARFKDLSDEALLEQAPVVWSEAESDLIDRVPRRYPEALGLWLLTRREDDDGAA
ncbi:MAG: methyltransferase domain-containing protein [Deltaproteobacteria bacterium]|nr:methyltransferase domain-containing protein [Deltaproteobacteria bacterium]